MQILEAKLHNMVTAVCGLFWPCMALCGFVLSSAVLDVNLCGLLIQSIVALYLSRSESSKLIWPYFQQGRFYGCNSRITLGVKSV